MNSIKTVVPYVGAWRGSHHWRMVATIEWTAGGNFKVLEFTDGWSDYTPEHMPASHFDAIREALERKDWKTVG